MVRLQEEELKQIQGGVLKIAISKVAIGIGIAVSFLIGIVNGYQNPLPCNK